MSGLGFAQNIDLLLCTSEEVSKYSVLPSRRAPSVLHGYQNVALVLKILDLVMIVEVILVSFNVPKMGR